uniref:Peroxisomal membrane protein PEX14-like KPWE domain-containing protein n=1 Tax=Astyanax mexicanus TaxID=7994 RepID=A0A8B9LJU8_ASTMX
NIWWNNPDSITTKSEQGDSLSFAEVFRMIQAGEEIPGLEKLDIKSCNQKPSVSQIPRKLKPWENVHVQPHTHTHFQELGLRPCESSAG